MAGNWVQLAHLLRPQGRRGELLAELYTDFPDRFAAGAEVSLAQPGTEPARTLTLAGYWLPVGRNGGRVVLHFAGVDSISAAEALAGLDVVVREEARVALDGDAEWIDDLVGATVYDVSGEDVSAEPVAVGVVEGVDFPLTADGTRRLAEAAPLLNVRTPEGGEVLIPYVRDFLVRLALAEGRIEMRLPAGLVELNLRPATSPAVDEPGA